jgi:hypothetical protein
MVAPTNYWLVHLGGIDRWWQPIKFCRIYPLYLIVSLAASYDTYNSLYLAYKYSTYLLTTILTNYTRT